VPTRPATPTGPVPAVAPPATAGAGVIASAAPAELLAAHGYVEEELFLSGKATSYQPQGDWGPDGRWTAVAGTEADYTTRVVVRRPRDLTKVNGTVLVEWLNVSSLLDIAVDFGYLNVELMDRGVIYVGVSAQKVGLESTKASDPERYAPLAHPGDEFSYDIFTQAGRAVLAGTLLPSGAKVQRIIADGESQSASRMTTYINAVQPVADVYDAFLVHSRGDRSVGVAPGQQLAPATIRTDLRSPTLVVLTETDVLGNLGTQQDDSDRYRRWEIAGTAHVDNYDLAVLSGKDPDQPVAAASGCEKPINTAHQWWVMNAGFRHLEAWIGDGPLPPSAPRLEIGPDKQYVTDEHGNAKGGIRLPDVEVPVATLLGLGNNPSWCRLFGITTAFTADQLASLYPTADAYRSAFLGATDRLVAAGFMLDRDVDSAKAYAGRYGTSR